MHLDNRRMMQMDPQAQEADSRSRNETTLHGGCRCGAVRYAVSLDQLPPVYCCHCLSCQSGSGSAFSEQAVVSESSIEASGPVLDYRFARPDGSKGHHRLCAECYTRLWSTSAAFPNLALLRAGTLDRSQELIPKGHMWTKRKQAWLQIPDGIPQWAETPPKNQLIEALGWRQSQPASSFSKE